MVFIVSPSSVNVVIYQRHLFCSLRLLKAQLGKFILSLHRYYNLVLFSSKRRVNQV